MTDTTELDALLDDAKEQWHFWCISGTARGCYGNHYIKTAEKKVTKKDIDESFHNQSIRSFAVMGVSYLGYMTNEEFGW
jgi:hypothetical protein